ncbi:MAG: glycosyltransferase family 39 protein [Candidatus Solibacter sp.]
MKIAVIVLLFLAVAFLCAHSNLPWSDEAWFASPALNLMAHGTFGTSVLDPTASFRTNNLTGIREHTYWIMPLYPLAEAAWFTLSGVGLMDARYLSVLWGLIALWAWYRMLRILTGDERVAVLAAGLLAVDFTFTYSASVARMDMMAAALGGAALTVYLLYRERDLARAVLFSQALAAAAGFTHPMAAGYCVALFVLTLYNDWRRIRIPHVLLAGAPYLAGAAGWGLYIMQAPHDFALQLGGNAAGRGIPLTDPAAVFHSQVMVRFLYMFGMAPDTRGFSRIKIVILAVYAAGVLTVLLVRELRTRPGIRNLLLAAGATLLTMMVMDREAQHHYLVHFVVWMASCTAVAGIWWWDRGGAPRWALACVLLALVGVQASTIARRITQRALSREYEPVTAYLKGRPGIVMGSAELAFRLGFQDSMVDDPRLGYRSGKRPDFVVIDHNRYAEWIPQYEQREPDTYRYIRGMLDREFQQVLDTGAYQLYARKP